MSTLQCGADVSMVNAQGLTALDIVNMYTDPRSAGQMKLVLQGECGGSWEGGRRNDWLSKPFYRGSGSAGSVTDGSAATTLPAEGQSPPPHGPKESSAAPHGPKRGSITPHGPKRGSIASHGPKRGSIASHGPKRGSAAPYGPKRGSAAPYGPKRGSAAPYGPKRGSATPYAPSRPKGSPISSSPAPLPGRGFTVVPLPTLQAVCVLDPQASQQRAPSQGLPPQQQAYSGQSSPARPKTQGFSYILPPQVGH